MFLQLVFIIIGFAILIWGADLLVSASSQIDARFGLPERLIGLTAVERIILLVVFIAYMGYPVFLGLRERESGHAELDP